MLECRLRFGWQRKTSVSLLPLPSPTGAFIDQIPELPVLPAFGQIQIARTQLVTYGQPQRDLPSALLGAALRVAQGGAQMGSDESQWGIGGKAFQLAAVQPPRDVESGEHGFRAGLRLERQTE